MGFVMSHHQQVHTLFLGHAHNGLTHFPSAQELRGKRLGELLGHTLGLGKQIFATVVDGFLLRIEGSDKRHFHHVQSREVSTHTSA
jgi:hypothetical protein